MKSLQKKWVVSILVMIISCQMSGCGNVVSSEEVYPEMTSVRESYPAIEETQQTEETTQENVEQNPSTEETVQLPEPEIKEATIVMVGDMLLHTQVNSSGKQEDGSYNYAHLFTHVAQEIQAADLALVNQEVILSGAEAGLRGYPRFNGAFELGDSLVDAGFDVVLHATNHSMDMGKDGLIRCADFWNNTYPEIGVVGIYTSEEDADTVYITEVNGIKMAVLNYTYGTNGIALPQDMPYAVDLWDEEKIAQDIAFAKENADFIIVCPHWGTEYVFEETSKQRKWAQFLADQGVDLCIGTHPHVIEPVEWVTGINGNEMLVYYSIGNFINATSGTAPGVSARMLGAMAQVTVTMEEEECSISAYDALPLIAHVEKETKENNTVTTYLLDEYTQELAARHYMNEVDPDYFSISYFYDLFRQVFGDL